MEGHSLQDGLLQCLAQLDRPINLAHRVELRRPARGFQNHRVPLLRWQRSGVKSQTIFKLLLMRGPYMGGRTLYFCNCCPPTPTPGVVVELPLGDCVEVGSSRTWLP
jgi:hypothetical protein